MAGTNMNPTGMYKSKQFLADKHFKEELKKKKNVKKDDKQITLTFVDKETAQYVRLICTRKEIKLEDYILDNFEWDTQPSCFSDLNKGEKITYLTCDGCEYIDKCPDAVKEKK